MTTKEKLIATLGLDDRKLLLIAIPVVAFIIPFLFFKVSFSDGWSMLLAQWVGSLMYTISYWISIRATFIYMRRRFPNVKDVSKRILYTILSVIIIFITLNYFLDFIHRDILKNSPTKEVTEWDYAVASFMIIALVSAIYESAFLYHRWKETVVETERLRRENVESQLEGLRNQVNPHFLFNSLNTLIYIIPEAPERAVRFVQKLSKVYRYILEIREKKIITLEEELDFLEAYIFLLKERFGDNLQIDLHIPESLKQSQIVPLSLQILFENAIKHNIISKDKPLKIEVFAEDGHLVVQNNLQKKKQTMPSTNVGLENIRNRYAFFSAEPVEILTDTGRFRVSLPLLKYIPNLAEHNV